MFDDNDPDFVAAKEAAQRASGWNEGLVDAIDAMIIVRMAQMMDAMADKMNKQGQESEK